MSNQVLLVVKKEGAKDPRVAELCREFKKRGYEIRHVSMKNLILFSLGTTIQTIRKKRQRRLCFLSNHRSLLFSSYRAYNGQIDDFIYLPSRDDKDSFSSEPVKSLANLNGIETETLHGKIYVQMGFEQADLLFPLLLLHHRFVYFTRMEEFDWDTPKTKKSIGKEYKLGNRTFSFKGEGEKAETVSIDPVASKPFAFDQDFFQAAAAAPQWTVYLTRTVLKMGIPADIKGKVATALFHLHRDSPLKERIFEQIQDYIKWGKDSFPEKVNLLTASLALKKEDGLLKLIHQTLLEDRTYIAFHYPLLASTLGFVSYHGLQKYKGIYQDQRVIMARIVEFYQGHVKAASGEKKKGKVVIIAGQLLAQQHAPTAVVLNYAKQLKLVYPELEIKIFVDDTFVYSPGEVIFSNAFSAAASRNFKETHLKMLGGSGIDLIYSDPSLPRMERLKRDLAFFEKEKPEVIWSIGANFSLVGAMLFQHYPIFSTSLGGEEALPFAHVFSGGLNRETIEKEWNKFGGESRTYLPIHHGIDLKKAESIESRKAHGFAEDDIVLVTVGNRLDADLSGEFVEIMKECLEKNTSVEWCVIGKGEFSLIHDGCSDLIDNGRIHFIDYHPDLPAFYQLCDVYVNPFRKGGGISAAMAMDAGIPVVTLKSSADTAFYVGNEAVEDEEFSGELYKLCRDSEYRKKKGAVMKDAIQKFFDFSGAVDDISRGFEMAKTSFDSLSSDTGK
ncbi:glycosyltransferase [Falsibacillus pallidus]|uniref:Glycosyltransferase involved in cell wall biosynthesis n=1 Tax=Falsibacillus pallidus TaxID=493781 RepID=A0A370GCC1_9BACI|nr:glycosyltransferase [Falsibacillus pallidus]RDI40104.1 glycosyltransferase involved in cell wall biosynthesis [Falsibacillus pallidus]